jgi:3-oxoacyl-[acyl-carrier-protein] synthase III
VLFGDGAGAVVVAAATTRAAAERLRLGADGSQADILFAEATSARCAWRAARSTATRARMVQATREALSAAA